MKRFLGILIVATLLPGRASPAGGEETLSLGFFEEEARVLTASRRPQTVFESPVDVEVITAEEIRRSKALDLWELMRFRAGVDVLEGRSIDGTRGVVAVRGFPQVFANSLQVLVDGRSVYSALHGGVFWEQLPVQIQDIERIEIVRGPNAALYGSNAGLGVVNILTKKPAGKTSVSAGALAGDLGIRRTEVAVESGVKDFRVRLSHTRRTQDGFRSLGAGTANDFLHSNKFNFRGSWSPTDPSTLELLGGSSWDTTGGTAGDNNALHLSHFVMLRYLHGDPDELSWELMASRSESWFDITPYPLNPSLKQLGGRAFQYDAEGLNRVALFDEKLKITSGLSYRNTRSRSDQVFGGAPKQLSRIWRGFTHQSLSIGSALTLVGAVSLEDSTTGGTQPAYQAAVLGRVREGHAVRGSYSMAPTIPDFVGKYSDFPYMPFVTLVGDRDLKPQKLDSYELGYEGAFLSKRVRASATLFYTRIRHLETTEYRAMGTVIAFVDNNEAIARGLETSLRCHLGNGRTVYLNYTHERVTDKLRLAEASLSTPKHKVNVGGEAALGKGVSVGLDAGYKSAQMFGTTTLAAVPGYWKVDARVSWRPRTDVEIFIVGKDLNHKTHREFNDGLDVPRRFYGGLTVSF